MAVFALATVVAAHRLGRAAGCLVLGLLLDGGALLIEAMVTAAREPR